MALWQSTGTTQSPELISKPDRFDLIDCLQECLPKKGTIDSSIDKFSCKIPNFIMTEFRRSYTMASASTSWKGLSYDYLLHACFLLSSGIYSET